MGNCSLKGITTECQKPIRILTDSGTIINFHGANQVDQILKNHPPGYGVFRQGNPSSPLPITESLDAGKSYLLLPLSRAAHEPPQPAENLGDGSGLEVLPAGGDGVWRVKLVIETKKLEEILAEEVNTEALIERMRAAAAAAGSPRRGKRAAAWKPTVSGFLKVLNVNN